MRHLTDQNFSDTREHHLLVSCYDYGYFIPVFRDNVLPCYWSLALEGQYNGINASRSKESVFKERTGSALAGV